MTKPVAVTPETLRRWLGRLRHPDKLGREPQLIDLVTQLDRAPSDGSPTAKGRAAALLLRELIERIRPDEGASRAEMLPYDVARLCFVDDVPLLAAADRLGMSARQLSRERSRAIAMLIDELTTLGHAPATSEKPDLPYRLEPIPAIAGFLPRRRPLQAIDELLRRHRAVHVHGPAGGGKTTLVAELASEWISERPVLWYRLRSGLNDSLPALLFEIGQHLIRHGRPRLSEATGAALVGNESNVSLVSRIAVQEMSGHDALLVVDDYHVAAGRPGIIGFLDDVVARLDDIRIVTVGRDDQPRLPAAAHVEVPPLSATEIRALLRQLGDLAADEHVGLVTHWTRGLPYLVQLAASWLSTAAPEEVDAQGNRFGELEEVQVFLLDALTGLMDTSDRAVLEAASIFRDRFTDPALAHVASRTIGQVADTSRRLVNSHLGSRSRQGGITLLCEVLREYVYQRMAATTRWQMHARAADWYLGQAQPDEAAYHRALAEDD